MSAEELLVVALELTETERIVLATRLLESAPDSDEELVADDPQLIEEVDRRSSDLTGAIPAENLWKTC